MKLTLRHAGWPNPTQELWLDDQRWGYFKSRFWGKEFAIYPHSSDSWTFVGRGWSRPTYELVDDHLCTRGNARRVGFWSSVWQLQTSMGPCSLKSTGWLNRRYELVQGNAVGAVVTPTGTWRGGWTVTAHDPVLTPADLLLILLVCHRVRQQAQQATG